MITADTRESNGFIQKSADERRFLKKVGPGGENWSYDLEVETKAGQVLTFERKAMGDCIESFKQGKLDRQCSYVDALIVEWDEMALALTPGLQDPKYQALAKNCKRHLWRMSLSMPVLWTSGPGETIEMLRWFEGKDKPFTLQPRASPTEGPQSPPPW